MIILHLIRQMQTVLSISGNHISMKCNSKTYQFTKITKVISSEKLN